MANYVHYAKALFHHRMRLDDEDEIAYFTVR